MKALRWVGVLAGIYLLLLVVVAGVGATLPREITVSRSTRIRTAPEAVWAILTDYANTPSWNPAITMIELPNSPDAEGRVRGRARLAGSSHPLLVEVLEARAPKLLVLRMTEPGIEGALATMSYEVSPDESGSTVRLSLSNDISNPILRLFARLSSNRQATLLQTLRGLRARAGE